MSTDRPTFAHRPARHGLIGPFSGRQLLLGAVAVLVVAVIGVVVTTPLGITANGPILGAGSTYQLRDLQGQPITLAKLRGKVVWLNFFASWCPPCQQETPILRSLAETYGDRGLALVGISVQETTVADVAEYADRYRLRYTIGFDGTGDVLREYKVFALPTQFFIDAEGIIRQVVSGPVDEQGARALIVSMLAEARPS